MLSGMITLIIIHMSKPTFINSKVVYHDNSREYNIDARGKDLTSILQVCETEEVTPVQDEEDFFKYIHVAVTSDQERMQINRMAHNIVKLPRMKQICDELYALIKKEKILSTIKPEAMLAELRRIGMPSADTPGFSDQNFYSNYRA